MKEYLPLGSVVMLEEGDIPILIYGRKQIHVDSGDEFDYVACLYPQGNINEDYTYLFNHDQINEVIFEGYSDDSDREFIAEYLQD